MEFSYSEELLEIKRTVRDFAECEIRSHVLEWDEQQIFPRDVLQKLAGLGFMGVLIPAEYGGAGLGYLEYVTVVEELSRVDGSIGISVAAHNSLCTAHIFNSGTEEQRRRFVVPLAKGEKIGAWSLTEPEAGSDDGGRISIAALAVGMAQGAYEAALNYSKQRRQFGKAISEFQAIQFKLADMITEIDCARLLTHRAAWMKDQGMQTTAQSSMAKLYSGEVAVRVANECVQIHGGYGYIKEYPAEKFYRDVKLCTIGEGTSEIQRLVIAREILKQ